MKLAFALVFLATLTSTSQAAMVLPPGCQYDRECVFELPGAVCADGTASYYTLTPRRDSSNLLIYLNGGGACWDAFSCGLGFAVLSRPEPGTDWNQGTGIFDGDSAANPLARTYNTVTVPYCTGDVFTGDNDVRSIDERGQERKYKHRGYNNVLLTLKAVKALFPDPSKVVLIGQSAGGIGAFYHTRNLVSTFPGVPTYVIDDAGTPFKPPYIKSDGYEKVKKTWAVQKTLPVDGPSGMKVENFGQMLEYNRLKFPQVRFGYISSYSDKIMTFFASSVGSPDASTAIRKTMIDVSNNHMGTSNPLQRVFYLEGKQHCFLNDPLEKTVSLKTPLSQWVRAMLEDDDANWKNIRPDLVHRMVNPFQWEPIPQSIDELRADGIWNY